jgi:hypothetical protein
VADRTVILDLLGRDRVTPATDSAGESVGRFGSNVERASSAAKVALAGMGAAAVVMAKDSIAAASDLNETLSKSKVVLGSAADSVIAWSKSSATSLGQSQKTALDAAVGFAAIGKSVGMTGKPLATFSTKFTGLASDLASFNNTSPEEAIEALSAAFRGEAEPIRAYGVMLDAASVKAQAMSMGLVKATKDTDKIKVAQIRASAAQSRYNKAVEKHGKSSTEAKSAQAGLISSQATLNKAVEGSIPDLTQQQQVLATQALVLKQTKDAQGDFARTSDGVANKQRILSARVEDLRAKIGQGLLPVMQTGVTTLTNLAMWVSNNQSKALALAGAVVGVTAAVAAVSVVMRVYAAVTATVTALTTAWAWAMGTATTQGKLAAAATRVWAAGQWLLNAALSANPIGLVIVGIAALVGGLIVAYKKSATFRSIVQGAWAGVKSGWDKLMGALKAGFGWLKTTWQLTALAMKLTSERIKTAFFIMGLAIGRTIEKVLAVAASVPGVGKVFRSARDAVRKANEGMQRSIDASKAKVDALKDEMAGIRSKSVTVTVNTKFSPGGSWYDPRARGAPRAAGGPVTAGAAYWVGERGPELMVPSQSGTVLSSSRSGRMSGGGDVHVHIHTQYAVGGSRQFRNDVVAALREAGLRGVTA